MSPSARTRAVSDAITGPPISLVKLPVGWALALPLGLTAEVAVLAGLGLWRIRGERWLSGASAELVAQ